MEHTTPKAVEAEMMASFLKVTFDNGEVRYLRSGINKELTEAFSLKKGKKKNILLPPHMPWIGTKVEVKPDGSIVLNEKEVYTPAEIWENSKAHISEL